MLRSVASSVLARSRTMATTTMATTTTTATTATTMTGTRCRNFSSSVVRRTKPRGGAVPRTKISAATAEAETLEAINLRSDPNEVAVIDNQVRMKNGIMAVSLAGFCFFVAWYSMHAVGQAGNDEQNNNSDPLAVLKQEAAMAQEKQEKQQAQELQQAAVMKQFQAGEFDPDKLEEEEEDDDAPKTKKAWWKFWSRG